LTKREIVSENRSFRLSFLSTPPSLHHSINPFRLSSFETRSVILPTNFALKTTPNTPLPIVFAPYSSLFALSTIISPPWQAGASLINDAFISPATRFVLGLLVNRSRSTAIPCPHTIPALHLAKLALTMTARYAKSANVVFVHLSGFRHFSRRPDYRERLSTRISC
jgi:hypothetical protein